MNPRGHGRGGLFFFVIFSLLTAANVPAATLYVWMNSGNPTPPYATWDTAAHVIQDAVNSAQAGDTVLVTNGVYQTGRRIVHGIMPNRLVINKPITVQSVDGPVDTQIVGATLSSGEPTMRCAYVGANAVLSGFVLSYGVTRAIGDPGTEQSGGGVWCEPSGVVSNCWIQGNLADTGQGGGAYGGTLKNCRVSNNSAKAGGGAALSTLVWSHVLGNFADQEGGGCYGGTLKNCLVSDNIASRGGGAAKSTFVNCLVTANSASGAGGGADASTLYNCTVVDNSVDIVWQGYGGGVFGSTLDNCIVYYNTALYGPNWSESAFQHSCATPLPTGLGNIASEPGFVNLTYGDYHLRHGSPCIDSGADLSAHLSDDLGGTARPLDGNADGTATFDIGAYEYLYRAPRTLYVRRESSQPKPPYTNWATAAQTIQEAVDAAGLGDTVLVTNGVYATGGRAVPGTYTGFMSNRVLIDRAISVRSLNGPNVTSIVGAPAAGGGNGEEALRCVYLGYGAVLDGFTLTNGHTRGFTGDDRKQSGGGVFAETTATVWNCVLSSNTAYYGGGAWGGTLNHCTLNGNSAENYGGGTYFSDLYSCQVIGNSAVWGGGGVYGGTHYNCSISRNSGAWQGGGAYGHTFYNCTIADNSARSSGGGVASGTLYNCIVLYNTAPDQPNYSASTFAYSCTIPATRGDGNIAKDPAFISALSGDFRLSYGSPCIDAGTNLSAVLSNDLAGNPRPIDGNGDGTGVFDMGAYEYNPETVDSDNDGATDWAESVADTDPVNAFSSLRITAITGLPEVTVFFTSSAQRLYTLLYRADLAAGNPGDVAWTPVTGQKDIRGSGGVDALRDTNAVAPRFYRVSVRMP